MNNLVDLQIAYQHQANPSIEQFNNWVSVTLQTCQTPGEITIRIVNSEEMQLLNFQYRQKNYATNVLSFPFDEKLIEDDLPLLGDIVLCTDVIIEQATQQQKSVIDHFAHLTIHGVLHLLGYDHEDNHDAERMEKLEITILKKFNIDNPYSLTAQNSEQINNE